MYTEYSPFSDNDHKSYQNLESDTKSAVGEGNQSSNGQSEVISNRCRVPSYLSSSSPILVEEMTGRDFKYLDVDVDSGDNTNIMTRAFL